MSQRTLDQRMLGVGTALTDHTITASDVLTFNDTDGSNKRDTVQGVLDLAGGGLKFISGVDASGASTVDLTGIDDTYDVYKIYIADIVRNEPGGGNNPALLMQVGFTGDAGFHSSSEYHWASDGGYSGSGGKGDGASGSHGNTQTSFNLMNASTASSLGTSSGGGMMADITLGKPATSAASKYVTWVCASSDDTPTFSTHQGGGRLANTGVIDSVSFFLVGSVSGYTITGSFRLYGVAKS